ncbi:hypothetical protein HHK36_014146 [Tetracentron sinense]|uniref:Galactose oxidase n=1 Tax=Tetracentron sinense TaxID=13715 RepID=A0A835DEX6_TETSI|nr:hypothetical protein HHK36_014146 [Tetracentron sinense]
MAVLLRALCLLPLLFALGFSQLSFFEDPDPLKDPFREVLRKGYSNINGGGRMAGRKADFETVYNGGWELVSASSGVSAMHLILFPNNKAIMFDATIFGPSQVPLARGNCRLVPGSKKKNDLDCWAHAVEYDIDTAAIRPLKVLTNTWCSSGGLSPDGTLVQTGGWNDGGQAVRYLSGCKTCDWKEYPTALSGKRWYSTQQILPDGSFILVGGRRMFNYEYVPKEGKSNPTNYNLPFLRETTDVVENNLYPFVHLSTDGNLFILANNRSILLSPITNKIIREFPILPGGSRNYPASGMSVLLPIKLHGVNAKVISAEVLVCGGAKPEAAKLAENNTFIPALQNCGRIQITNPKAVWKMEIMPTPRVMGDMLILPTGDVLMINGAKKGTSGWQFADDPNLTPVLYRPMKPIKTQRFKELQATTIPRMYHSSSAVLPDGKILVAGSNTNNGYDFTGVKFPTELRVEKFLPPYLDPLLAIHKPLIMTNFKGQRITYAKIFMVQIKLTETALDKSDLRVTIYAPPFTTHGYSMNQRLVFLAINEVVQVKPGMYQIATLAPPTGAVTPPGYYLLFVVHRGVPSRGVWIQIF